MGDCRVTGNEQRHIAASNPIGLGRMKTRMGNCQGAKCMLGNIRGPRVLLLTSWLFLALVLGGCSDDRPSDELKTAVSPIAATLSGAAAGQLTANSRAGIDPSPTAVSRSIATTATTTSGEAVDESSTESATTGLLLLSAIPVKPRGVKTGYSRDQFGEAWTDDVPVDGGGNGCSTREDILRRDLIQVVMMSVSDHCTVLSGILEDEYTATVIPFQDRQSSPIDIDHLVSLSDAWQSGANSFTPELRQDLANDPVNLQAVSSQANRQKGDGDAATWLPGNKAYRCEYVRRQIDVKVKYQLWVKPAESDAMKRVLTGCGGIPPVGANAVEGSTHSDLATDRLTTAADPSTSIPAMTAEPTTPVSSAPPGGADYFANCAAARAAGRAPLLRGEPGYRAEMDGDGDGIACEVAR